jgi:hypothetical protein
VTVRGTSRIFRTSVGTVSPTLWRRGNAEEGRRVLAGRTRELLLQEVWALTHRGCAGLELSTTSLAGMSRRALALRR